MGDVISLFRQMDVALSDAGAPETLKPGGEPPDNGGMEARVAALEAFAQDARDRLVRLEAKLEDVQKNMATTDGTKAAIAEAKNSIVMWIVGAVFLAQFLPALLKKFGL